MIKLGFLDLICEVSYDAVGSDRELLAVINQDIDSVRAGEIKDENFKFLEFNEVDNFIMQLHFMEDKFKSAYMCDSKIVCRFKDEQFVIDLI